MLNGGERSGNGEREEAITRLSPQASDLGEVQQDENERKHWLEDECRELPCSEQI